MATYASIFKGASSSSDLEDKLNKALSTEVINEVVNSSFERTSGGDNRAGLVFGTGNGNKLQVVIRHAGRMDLLHDVIESWTKNDGEGKTVVNIAMTYDNDETRVMLVYEADSNSGTTYGISCLADDGSGNQQDQVDAIANQNWSEFVAATGYGGGKFRAVLLYKK